MKTSKIVTGAVVLALSAGTYGVAEAASSTKATKVSLGTAGLGTAGLGSPQDGIKTVLDGLVTKGTITAAQETAIIAALDAARPAKPVDGPRGMGGFGKIGGADIQTVITTTLGIDAATLQAGLQAGKSLATIAGTKTQALITAIVAAQTKAIDAAVTAGKLTAAQATTLKADLVTRVTTEVNEVHPAGAPGAGFGGKGGRGPGKGHGGHGGDDMGGMSGTAPALGAPSTSGSSSNG